jgi:hypothetical protein
MYQVDPIPLGAPGPIKLKVSRANWEVAGQDMNAKIECQKGTFLITGNKRKFQMDDGLDIFLIADVRKIINK